MEASGYVRGVSELINVRDFIKKWDKTVIPGIPDNDKRYTPHRELLAEELDVDSDTVAELETVCSPRTLLCGEEKTDIDMLNTIPDNLNLVAARMQRQELKKRERDKVYKTLVGKKMKYTALDERNNTALYQSNKTAHELGEFAINLPNVILSVQVYQPLKQNHTSNKAIPDMKFYVLGTQKLTDLRDQINCANDLAVAHDLSETPENDMLPFAKDIYKSGFFYIEGVFYNDMRYPECQDYSLPIRQWAAQGGKNIGDMSTAKMEDTLFIDLSIKLGQPYCYYHQGNCEHLVIFSDVRLFTPEDSLDVRNYPRLIKKKRSVRTLCKGCQMFSARWIVYDSEHAPENPCFFCDQCFKSFHYTENGEKIGKFKAYKYVDPSAMTNLI